MNESTPFKNDLGFIAHLLKRDHGITANKATIWRIICESVSGDEDRAKKMIPVISNGPVELATLAEDIRNMVNGELNGGSYVQPILIETRIPVTVLPAPVVVGSLDALTAVGLVSFVAGCLVSFLVSHWS